MKRDIVFVYHHDSREQASTVLRGEQLSSIVDRHLNERRGVEYTRFLDFHGKIVILTKGMLERCSVEQLADLRSKDNILVADFIDAIPIIDLLPEIDVLLASSVNGHEMYKNDFPNHMTAYVTHHIDTRIQPQKNETVVSEFRAAYFGSPRNTYSRNVSFLREQISRFQGKAISSFVDFNQIVTDKKTTDWIDLLPNHNFHYAVRRDRDFDGPKPFVKGFIAAKCNSNMMIQRDSGDAEYYLGEDYPFYLTADPSISEIVDGLKYAKDSFGGPDWAHGLEIMADIRERSSLHRIGQEFSKMIDLLD